MKDHSSHLAPVLALAVSVASATGCSKGPPAPVQTKGGEPAGAPAATPRPSEPAAQTVAHAPASVTPGSHEDWCGEHGVAESMCTRCNPTLVAAFQATGDWCKEHGVPESQCLLCNPGLKLVRPTRSATATRSATPEPGAK